MLNTQKAKTMSVQLVFVLAGCLFGAGCEDAIQTPPPAKKAEKAKKAAPAPVVAEEKVEEEEYMRPEYPNAARRNPFQPDLEVIKPATTAVKGEVRTKEPLERFGLGQLALVAIVSEVAVPEAMFIDPDGFGHVVKEGDRIGQNGGYISDIRDNEVEVIEGSEEEDGQTLQKIVKLREVELETGEDGLTDEERKALERLLETEAGRKAVERSYRENAPGAAASESGAKAPPPTSVDPRYRGMAPPSR